MTYSDELKIVILGGGLAGLASAYSLFKEEGYRDIVVLERNNRVGGTARTIDNGVYRYDLTGHAFHLSSSRVMNLVFNELQLRGALAEVRRSAVVHTKGRTIPYPFQYNLAYLDESTRNRCVIEFLKSYYARSARKDFRADESSTKRSFEDYCRSEFGDGIAQEFLIPYNEKLWAACAKEISSAWTNDFMPKPSFERIIGGAFRRGLSEKDGYNATFYYPKQGGIQTIADSFCKPIEHMILTNQEVTSIDLSKKKVFCGNAEYDYDHLISSIPLPRLLKLSGLASHAQGLKWTIVRAFFVSIPSEHAPQYSWIYLPDPENVAYRLGNFSMFSKSMMVDDRDVIWIECAASNERHDSLPSYEEIRREFGRSPLIDISQGQLIESVDLEPGYVVYDFMWREKVKSLRAMMASKGVTLVGRYGSWKYESMEQAILDGLAAADSLGNRCLEE